MSALRIRRLAVLVLIITVVVTVWVWTYSDEDAESVQRTIAERFDRRDFDVAEQLATEAITRFPSHPEFGWMAAQSAEAARHFEAADRLASQISGDQPWALDAYRLRARVAEKELNHLQDAENACLAILQHSPRDLDAHEQLARQYGFTARRYEAIPHILELVRGERETDLILLVGRERGMIRDDDKLTACRKSAPQDPRPLLGLAWHAMNDERHAEAEQLLREAVQLGPDLPAAWALQGRWLAARKQDAPWREWIERCPTSADSHPDVWYARGEWADRQNDRPAALRCYWECVLRSPENRPATMRLAQLLAESGDGAAAERCRLYLENLLALESAQERAFSSGDTGGKDLLPELIEKYQAAGRLWEALALCRVAVQLVPQDPVRAKRLADLTQATRDLPLVLTAPGENPATGLDFSGLPLPRGEAEPVPHPGASAENTPVSISFEDQSEAAGFRFRFDDGSRGPRLKMHEITGGGIAVLDFDVDGYPDLYCTQAGTQPPGQPMDQSDQLFRNQQGQRFQSIGGAAGVREHGFGQGASVGDLNSDGFPDVFVGNIGSNALWINEGDGTFTESATAWGLSGAVWTTSSLIADLNRDGHPDLYEVNYLRGDRIFERICRMPDGSDSQCMPFDFDGEVDHLWLSSGEGQLIDSPTALTQTPDGKGLGIAAWRPDPSGPLCVLVANDTTPNYFWVPEDTSGEFRFAEQGLLAGLALSQQGKPQGSMGISVGDVDGDSRMDACVTNFLAESYAFYRATDTMSFRDEAQESGLRDLTWQRLGFGTLLIDADGDGQLELFLANGHIQDLRRLGRPYRMPPLLCRCHDEKFLAVDSQQLGPYFQSEWLARAATSLDWNRDGRVDLAVGHLDDPTVLLTNTSPSAARSLTLRLVARDSARDAVGTILTFRQGTKTWTRQLIGGGGYQASHEALIHWSLPDVETLDELIVQWPSGRQQRFPQVSLPLQGVLIEGADRLLEIGAAAR